MALPKEIGSVNDEFDAGATDGTYKKVIRDRGGIVEDGAWQNRRQLSVKLYGIAEAKTKVVPTRGEVVTLDTVATRDPEQLGY